MKYDAFISYPQNPDKNIAVALQNALRKLGAKKYLLRFRALQIFRDETDFSGNESLKQKIEKGLDDSEYLVVLASPKIAYASSPNQRNWIEEEIKYWIKTKHPKEWESGVPVKGLKIILCITDGMIQWSDNDFDWKRTNCLPPILKGKFADIPLWVDLRELKQKEEQNPSILKLDFPLFKQKTAEISSKIQNLTVDQLIGKDILRKRIWKVLLSFVLVLLVVLTFFAIRGNLIASKEKRVAQSRALASQGIVNKENSYDLALLLAASAYEVSETEESKSALYEILQENPNLLFYQYNQKPIRKLTSNPSIGDEVAIISWGNLDSEIIILNLETGHKALLPKGILTTINQLEFSPSGNWLIAGDLEGNLLVYNVLNNYEIHKNYFPFKAAIEAIQFINEDELIISTRGESLLQYNLLENKIIRNFPTVHCSSPTALCFLESENLLFSAGADTSIVVWDLSIEDTLTYNEMSSLGWTLSMDITSDGKLMALGKHNGNLEIWDFELGTISQLNNYHEGRIFDLQINENGTLFTVGDGGSMNVKSLLKSYQQKRNYVAHSENVYSVTLTLDGKIFTAGGDGRIGVWDFDNWEVFIDKSFNRIGARNWFENMTFISQNGEDVFMYSDGNRLLAINDNGIVIDSINVMENITDIVQIDTSEFLLTSDNIGSLKKWKLNGSLNLTKEIKYDFSILKVIPNTTGCYFVAQNGAVGYWNTYSDEFNILTFIPLNFEKHKISKVLYDLPSNRLVILMNNYQIHMYNIGNKKHLIIPVEETPNHILFSTNGELLISESNKIIFWNLNTKTKVDELLCDFIVEDFSIVSNYCVVTGKTESRDNTGALAIWDIETKEKIGKTRLINSQNLSIIKDTNPLHFYIVGWSYDQRNGLYDYQFYHWQLNSERWSDIAYQIANRNLTDKEIEKYLK